MNANERDFTLPVCPPCGEPMQPIYDDFSTPRAVFCSACGLMVRFNTAISRHAFLVGNDPINATVWNFRR